jgi:hypothetical protein
MGEQMFTIESEVISRPSALNDDLVQSVDQKIYERRCFTILGLLYEFPSISRTLLYEIIIVWLGYHKFCARWVSKILTSAHKT